MTKGLSVCVAWALALAAPAAALAEPLPTAVEAALAEASALPGARVMAADYKESLPAGCVASSAVIGRAVDGSGRYPVKLSGERCSGWAWVKVQVWAEVPITTRAVKAGERLDGAVAYVEKEIAAGRPPIEVGPATVAARPLPRGQWVQAAHVRGGATTAAGTPVKVVARIGALVIEQTGKTVPCGRGGACAVLPSGRHVQGRLEDGRLIVESP